MAEAGLEKQIKEVEEKIKEKDAQIIILTLENEVEAMRLQAKQGGYNSLSNSLNEYDARQKYHASVRAPFINKIGIALTKANKAVKDAEELDQKIAAKRAEKNRCQEKIDADNDHSAARKRRMEEIKQFLQNQHYDSNLKYSMQKFMQHLNTELKASNMPQIDTQELDSSDQAVSPNELMKMADNLVKTYDKPKKSLLATIAGSKISSMYDLLENSHKSRATMLKTAVNDCDRELKNLNKKHEAGTAAVGSSGKDLIKLQKEYEAMLLKQRNEAAVIKGEAEHKFRGSSNIAEFREDRATAKLAALEVLKTENLFREAGLDRGKIAEALKEPKESFLGVFKKALEVFAGRFASGKVKNDLAAPAPKTPAPQRKPTLPEEEDLGGLVLPSPKLPQPSFEAAQAAIDNLRKNSSVAQGAEGRPSSSPISPAQVATQQTKRR